MDELTSEQDALEPTEQSQSEPASATPQQSKPADVVSREDFQRFQSLKDREIAQTRLELQAAQQQMAQMRQTVDEIRMSGMDDYQKLQYQMQIQQQTIRQLANEKAQAEQVYQAAMAQERLVSRIERKTGIDRKAFYDAELSPDDLWEKAWDIRSERGGKQQQQVTRRPAGQVDLGSGTPAPVSSDPDQRRKRATTQTFSADEYLDSLWDDE